MGDTHITRRRRYRCGGNRPRGRNRRAVRHRRWVDARDPNGDTGWIFDFDPTGDQAYFLNGTPPFAPIAPSDGSWHIVDQGVGSVGDVNTPHTICLVDASPACVKVLHAAKPNADDDVSFKTLPVGCSVVDSVDVTVAAYPSESPGM
ncbi:hypothetical protein [Streptomyces sp. NPDC021020]|uniref:hypothetical protein n=1 Tax=Streptomyces sp. NPDC021020 TaxID=3365109 RepID=UPI00379112F8